MQLFHFILALLVVAIWGFNFVFVKIGLTEVSPLLLAAVRFLFAAFPLIFFIKKPNIPFKMLAYYALFMFVGQQAFFLIAMHLGMTASLSSILMQTQIFPTVLLSVLFLRERLSFWQIGGALISFIGIGIVAMHRGGEVSLLGLFLILSSAFSWAAGNFVSKKIGPVNTFSLVVWGSLLSWPLLLLVSWMVEGPGEMTQSFQQASWKAVIALAYMVYPSTLFAYWAWNWLLSLYPAATIAPFSLLAPVFGMLGSVWILDESLQTWKIIAALFIIGGLCVNLLGPRIKEVFRKWSAIPIS